MRDLINPMTDIVERLRRSVTEPTWSHTRDIVIYEAAAEIERLRAELKGATDHVHRAQAATRKANGNA